MQGWDYRIKSPYKNVSVFLKQHYLETLIIISAFAQIAVIYQSGYFGDDFYAMFNIHQPGNSYWLETINRALEYFNYGRFHFFHFAYLNMVAYLFGWNLFLYKSYLIFSMLLNIVLTGKLIYRITGSKYQKLLFMLFIPLFFQIYNYHNPITSYYSLMQTLLTLLILCLLNLMNYLKHRNKCYFIFAMIPYLFSLLIYVELSFLFLPIILGLLFIYRTNFKSFILNSIPFFALVLVNIFIVVYVRNLAIVTYDGIAFGKEMSLVIMNFFSQMITAFPLSHFLFTWEDGIVSHYINNIIANIKIQDIYIVVFFLYLLYKLKRGRDLCASHIIITVSDNVKLTLLGIGLFIFPSITYCFSEKYNILPIGTAYLNIYIQCFGLLILIIAITNFITAKYKMVIKPLLSVLYIFVCVVIILNQQNARLYIEHQNKSFLYPCEILKNAIIKQGILKNITEVDTLIVPWIGLEYNNIPLYAGKRMKLITESEFSRSLLVNNNDKQLYSLVPLENTYKLNSLAAKDTGILTIAPVDSVLLNNYTKKGYYSARSVQVYVPLKNKAANGIIYKTLADDTIIDKIIDTRRLKVTGEDEFGKMYSVELDTPAIMGSFSLIENLQNEYPMSIYPQINEDGISFGLDSNDSSFIVEGFSGQEEGFRWTEGKQAALVFRLNMDSPDITAVFNISPLIGGNINKQNAEVFINGTKVADWSIDKLEEKKLLLKKSLSTDGIFIVKFNLPNASTPKELGINDDVRQLALAFWGIRFIEYGDGKENLALN